VDVEDFGVLPDGGPFIAMSLLAGETLGARLDMGPLPMAHALGLFAELADAVAALHDAGLVHRDLSAHDRVCRKLYDVNKSIVDRRLEEQRNRKRSRVSGARR
jgi:serine/threonine protein kinase